MEQKANYINISQGMLHVDDQIKKTRSIIENTPVNLDSIPLYDFRMRKLQALIEQKQRLITKLNELLEYMPMEFVYVQWGCNPDGSSHA